MRYNHFPLSFQNEISEIVQDYKAARFELDKRNSAFTVAVIGLMNLFIMHQNKQGEISPFLVFAMMLLTIKFVAYDLFNFVNNNDPFYNYPAPPSENNTQLYNDYIKRLELKVSSTRALVEKTKAYANASTSAQMSTALLTCACLAYFVKDALHAAPANTNANVKNIKFKL